MSISPSINVLEGDVQQRLNNSLVQTRPISGAKIMHDELFDTNQSPLVEPGSSSTSRPSLNSLADVGSNERPPYSNFTLIKYAILGSPELKLTLAEIYTAISDRFPWYKNAGKSWKNSVRHCLSLDTQFYKEHRPCGKGCYWKVSVDTPRGNKRERKRKKKPSRRELVEEFQRGSSQPPTSFPLTPAFRDHGYATTAPAPRAHDYDTTAPVTSTALFRPLPLSQSGWTPYSPSNATNFVATPVFVQRYAEVTYPQVAVPSAPSASSASSFPSSAPTRAPSASSPASAARVPSARVPIPRSPSASGASLAPSIHLARVPIVSASNASLAPSVPPKRVTLASASSSSCIPPARDPLTSASSASSAARAPPARVSLASVSRASSAPSAPSVPSAPSIPRASSVNHFKLSSACHWGERPHVYSDDTDFESEEEQ